MNDAGKKTILLVEDEVLIAADEKISLEKYGYNVVLAKNGFTAINIIENDSSIDLILIDIDLGEERDGTEIAEIILKKREIPVVFLSSHTEPSVVEKTERITSYGYVVKNSNITVLDASIKMAFKLFEANKLIISSEIKQKAMISNSSDVICIIDSRGILKYVSPNITKLFGWDPDELLNTEWIENVNLEDFNQIRTEFQKLLESENSTISLEHNFKCKDGTYKQIDMTGVNLLHDPVINGVLINYHDISSRRKIEIQLNESKLLFSRLIESLPQNVYAKDIDGRFIFANRQYLSTMNVTLDELVSKTDYELHPSELAEKYRADDRLVMENNQVMEFEEEHQVIGKDKTYIQIIKAPFYNSNKKVIGVLGIFWDITRKKETENALRKSEQRYLSLFNNMTEGFALHVVVYDEKDNPVDYRFLDVNRAFETLTGLRRDEIVGKRQSKVLPNEDPYWLETYSRVAATGEPVHIEHFSPVLKKHFGVYAYSPAPDQFAVIFSDITERRNAELEIREKNEKLKSAMEEMEAANEDLTSTMEEMEATNEELINVNNEMIEKDRILQNERIFTEAMLECIPGLFYVYDENMHLIRWNKKHEEITGYSPDELKNISFKNWFDEKDVIIVMKAVDKVFSDGYGEVEAEIICKNGKKILCHFNGILLNLSGRNYFTGIGLDITKRKKAEEELGRKNEQFLKISSNVPGYLAYVDAETLKYEFVNDAYVKSFGLPREKIIGITVKDLLGNNKYEVIRGYIEEAKTGKSVSYESVFDLQEGKRWIKVNYSPVMDHAGKVISIAIFGYNITEEKHYLDKINMLLEEKEILLKEAYHRIKNNMNTIHSLLNLQANTFTDSAIIEAFKDATNRVRSMMILFDKLYQSIDYNEISTADYISVLIDEIIMNFPNNESVQTVKNIEDFKIDAKVMQTVGIIINELLTNIMKYAFNGRNDGIITVNVFRENGLNHFSIQDNGNGMPESISFENSTGFGLRLIEMLTKHLDGNLKIERKNGTKVILEFKM